jgi:excisionase family DNA binding protein
MEAHMPTNTVQSAVLDIAEAADYLGTTVSHVRALVARSEVAIVKVGRELRFRPIDLDDYIGLHREPVDTPRTRGGRRATA